MRDEPGENISRFYFFCGMVDKKYVYFVNNNMFLVDFYGKACIIKSGFVIRPRNLVWRENFMMVLCGTQYIDLNVNQFEMESVRRDGILLIYRGDMGEEFAEEAVSEIPFDSCGERIGKRRAKRAWTRGVTAIAFYIWENYIRAAGQTLFLPYRDENIVADIPLEMADSEIILILDRFFAGSENGLEKRFLRECMEKYAAWKSDIKYKIKI